ncbi:uncharacterized, partial [Tachysurus ichikawai]
AKQRSKVIMERMTHALPRWASAFPWARAPVRMWEVGERRPTGHLHSTEKWNSGNSGHDDDDVWAKGRQDTLRVAPVATTHVTSTRKARNVCKLLKRAHTSGRRQMGHSGLA